MLTNKFNYRYSFKNMINLSKLVHRTFAQNDQFFKNNGDVYPIENTENEILNSAKEIYSRLNNNWKITEDEEKLRKEFKKLITDDIYLYLNCCY